MSQPYEHEGKPAAGHEANPYESDREAKQGKSSRGCCLYGCLISVLLIVLLIVGVGVGGYWWVSSQVAKWTEDTPADLPTVEYTEEEVAAVEKRVESFKEGLEANEAPEELVLTADDINAMIADDEEIKGHVFIKIEDGKVGGDVSIPTDILPGGKGRFFNASATFNVSLENGVLIVTMASAEAKGQKVPQEVIDEMAKQNLAKDLYKEPEVAEVLRRIDSISIEGDKMILRARKSGTSSSSGDAPAGGEESSGDAEAPVEKAAADEAPADEAPADEAPAADAPAPPEAPTPPAAPASSGDAESAAAASAS
jgi:hypothetical protein